MNITRPTIMEVDLKSFEHNVQEIQKYIGNDIKMMPVVKANSYGTYINKVNEILNKFDIVAVAIVDEAIELRRQGYKKEIFILNQPAKQEIENVVKYDITIGVCDLSFLKELGKINKNVKIHLEIDSGMGRTGINHKNIVNFIEELNLYNNIKMEGIYTHLSSADIDFEYTQNQIDIFDKCVNEAQSLLGKIKYIHCSASNGILNFKNSHYNLVRPGIILYGYESCENTFEKMNLKPVTKLKSKVTFLKEVEKDTSIGYSRKFITTKKTKVATVPIGYADGLSRLCSNKSYVVINGKKAPIIGNVCMDSIMIDVTDIENVFVDTDVYIWDNELIKVEEIAQNCHTINYEILSTISNRVPRIFI